MTTTKIVDDFSSENEVPSNWVKFNVPQEDKIFGTLISVRDIQSTIAGKEGEMTKVYEIKADYGSFHDLDDRKKVIETPITVEPGSVWNIGGRAIIDKQMRNIKVGQKIGIKYMEEVAAKTKGYNPAKIIKVFTPKNDDGTYKMDLEVVANEGLNF